ncbi:sigma-54-dependent Fis family transcriptional regulator [Vibrio sp. SCSIO 43132]|uniref:sigma-54-dependent Fis family transcriptional regulator n=1 Tax=Vibrio sp. SCSIO 43132 TaxID=2779363 RepID=UPI001CAA1B1D|nr:sigma-54-dependent Fis family transcriptional regulator [Vibrio sp. SCSIO 43132]UAB71388.1 sigma-54-dependent Fis family transcriptional regulator [Vibrio sp. SCSIO 43132]
MRSSETKAIRNSTFIRSHIQEVESAISGNEVERDHMILNSWKRCVETHRLEPSSLKEAYILPGYELKLHQERTDRLIHTARHALEMLYKQISGQNYVLLLTDHEGVTVDYIGNTSQQSELKSAGLYLGSSWSEERAGTCGVGSCIYTGQSITVHQTDHFDATHGQLTCSASPIYGVDGHLAAVLDISALHSPEPKSSQWLSLQLIRNVTKRIEMTTLLTSFRHQWVLKLSKTPEFLELDPDCALAVNDDGQIVGLTHSAYGILMKGYSATANPLNAHQLGGVPLDSLLDLDINDLPKYSRRYCPNPVAVTTQSGDLLYIQAIEPVPVTPKSVPTERPIAKPLERLFFRDPIMKSMAEKASTLANSSISILISGETGAGKEYLAKAIHDASRGKRPFVAINCAAIPESLIESELFGYTAGSFTGADRKGKKGLIERANGGTLFLDEIGDMPLALQARLLRVIAEKEVTPVGGHTPVPVTFRVLAASHQNLEDLVKQGRFREDLYYRISGAKLEMPPLRVRKDIKWLSSKLLLEYADQPVPISQGTTQLLNKHHWPGNIRELSNVLQFALAFSQGEKIQPEHLPDSFSKYQQDAPTLPVDTQLETLLNNLNWNITAAANYLGVNRSTVHRRMKRCGLIPPNRR